MLDPSLHHPPLTAPSHPRDASSSPGASSPEPPTQRRRTSTRHNNEEASESDAVGPTTTNGAATTTSDTTRAEPVKKLIRLALACEYQRRPIRRAEISEKVLGATQGRQFRRVFDEAQDQLRHVFGMEMVELPAREKTLREKRAQKGDAAAGKVKGTSSWVLSSTLPSDFHDPEILPPGAAPTSAEEGTYVGLYTVLISLISLSGGSLPEAKLERYLRRLGMEDRTPVAGYGKTEMLLKRLEREGYLVKVKETATAGEEDVSWHVGPRGKVEVGDGGTRGLAGAVYGDLDEEGEEELERRLARSLAMGERVEAGAKRGGERAEGKGAKKRGRKKKAREEEEEEEEEDEDDDDEE